MAVRRTLKQKHRAVAHRSQDASYSYQASEAKSPKEKQSVAPKPVSQAEPTLSAKLFGYNPNLVYNDLLKTLVVTLIVVSVLIVIFIATR